MNYLIQMRTRDTFGGDCICLSSSPSSPFPPTPALSFPSSSFFSSTPYFAAGLSNRETNIARQAFEVPEMASVKRWKSRRFFLHPLRGGRKVAETGGDLKGGRFATMLRDDTETSTPPSCSEYSFWLRDATRSRRER